MYDSIIIGCGPAGITAAIYLLRANKKVLILEKEGIHKIILSSDDPQASYNSTINGNVV